jgi:hypothetical protein
MDKNLMELRRRTTAAAIGFIRAQRAYPYAAAPDAGKLETELRVAAGYRKAKNCP